MNPNPDYTKFLESIDFSKLNGLVPVVTQDAENSEVLMLAFADYEAVKATLATGYAHYHSRSRNSLWKKGNTSGNLQKIVEIRIDCDDDTLLYIVHQTGPACHTGNRSCFYRSVFRRQESLENNLGDSGFDDTKGT
ncbi:MAG: phosphoribosyl-AMP cyclohydrolase [Spirochaetaceae bacterium]|nr:phosphoribosyl-AMP cyclohydrolase [Spirochaetaceae bacterium]MCF7947497.1 phosphoribosyl-AMP cyclohydrolase [Spirochaetia bacterium]MCF7950603.1 phosphoribosyl-AMP cyclohydrolase [Spirochaetaceae bacterium]